MRRAAILLAAAAAAVAAPAAAAAPPAAGVLVPGRSLGGLTLGVTPKQVEAAWGRAYGVCRSCRRTTWYFNYYAFRPEGAGVEFRAGKAVALFTLWAPTRWSTRRGLALRDHAARITDLQGALRRTDCDGYYVLTERSRRAVTAYYVTGAKLWAFALLAPGLPVCR